MSRSSLSWPLIYAVVCSLLVVLLISRSKAAGLIIASSLAILLIIVLARILRGNSPFQEFLKGL